MFVEDRTIERDGRVHTYLSTIKNKCDKTTGLFKGKNTNLSILQARTLGTMWRMISRARSWHEALSLGALLLYQSLS